MNILKAIAGNGLLIAILGHGLVGFSLLWDKVLLGRRTTTNLVSYVFWLGAISIFGLALLPFGFQMPKANVVAIAFGAGVVELIANYFYYAALKAGEASEELAVMGGFTPVATALISVPLLKQPIGGQPLGFILLTLGGFVMFFADKSPKKKCCPACCLHQPRLPWWMCFKKSRSTSRISLPCRLSSRWVRSPEHLRC